MSVRVRIFLGTTLLLVSPFIAVGLLRLPEPPLAPVSARASAASETGIQTNTPEAVYTSASATDAVAPATATVRPTPLPDRGYGSRACGLDLDGDFVEGEPEDCRICDASLVDGRVAGGTLDPDGDGEEEHILYVESEVGSDRRGCGLPDAPPCKTIQYALSRMVDPKHGRETILCGHGTFESERLRPPFGGVPGARTRPLSGSEKYEIELPTNPARILGWDWDGDGAFPPHDRDDEFVFDGSTRTRAFEFNHDGLVNSYFEMAHFEARDYGRFTKEEDSGFARLNLGQRATHLDFHDAVLSNINRDRAAHSNRIVFNLFAAQGLRFVNFRNISTPDHGGYVWRGGGPETSKNPEMRDVVIQNWSGTAHGCDASGPGRCSRGENVAYAAGLKIWGYGDRLQILDSIYDANLDEWLPKPAGGPPGVVGLIIAECQTNSYIRNNLLINVKQAFRIQTYGGKPGHFCSKSTARPVGNVFIEENEAHWDERSTYWGNDITGVDLSGGGTVEEEGFGFIAVRRNYLHSETGIHIGIDLVPGNDSTHPKGRIEVTENRIDTSIRTNAGAAIRVRTQHAFAEPQGGLILDGNQICGLSPGNFAIRTNYRIPQFESLRNSFSPGARFSFSGAELPNLRAWRQMGQDADGIERGCLPLGQPYPAPVSPPQAPSAASAPIPGESSLLPTVAVVPSGG